MKGTFTSSLLLLAVSVQAQAPERFVSKIALPTGQTAVVAEGDLEARSIGSLSVRLYAKAEPADETTFFTSGLVRPRDGTVERIELADVDGDGTQEIVVITRSVGTGGYLSAQAVAVAGDQVSFRIEVNDLPANADAIEALRKAAQAAMAQLSWEATVLGVGPVKLGMTLAQAEQAMGRKLVSTWPGSDTSECAYYSAKPKIDGLLFMTAQGSIVRYDVRGPNVRTRSGIAVGDSVEHARAVYGDQLEVTPHRYTGPEDAYLTLWSNDRKTAIRFETLKGKIERFHAGFAEQAQYVEGCS
jgi:Periplasmic lysozyme inhibitor of I-type lysozyme